MSKLRSLEPIRWRILEESNGESFLLAEYILDSQAYQNTFRAVNSGNQVLYYNNSTGTPTGTFANNYKYSTIRAWLNDSFYETAFNPLQKSMILTTTVDNSARSTNLLSDIGTFSSNV